MAAYLIYGTIIMVISLIAFIINMFYIILCAHLLIKDFQKLSVLGLLFCDAFTAFSSFCFGSSLVFHLLNDYSSLCLFHALAFTFGLTSTHLFLFLICLQRLIAVSRKIRNGDTLGLIWKRHRFSIFAGIFTLSFMYAVLTTFLTPYEINPEQCTLQNLYGDKLRLYVSLTFGPVTFMTMLYIIITILSGHTIWKLFLKSNLKQRINDSTHVEPFNTDDAQTSQQNGSVYPISIIEEEYSQIPELDHSNKSYSLNAVDHLPEDYNNKTRVIQKPSTISLIEMIPYEETERSIGNVNQCVIKKNTTNIAVRELGEIEIKNSDENAKPLDIVLNESIKRKIKELRAFSTSKLIILTTIVLSGPFLVSVWIEVIFQNVNLDVRVSVYIIHLFNFIAYPFIYAFRIPVIKSRLKKACMILN